MVMNLPRREVLVVCSEWRREALRRDGVLWDDPEVWEAERAWRCVDELVALEMEPEWMGTHGGRFQ
jgi:hypothetical protein